MDGAGEDDGVGGTLLPEVAENGADGGAGEGPAGVGGAAAEGLWREVRVVDFDGRVALDVGAAGGGIGGVEAVGDVGVADEHGGMLRVEGGTLNVANAAGAEDGPAHLLYTVSGLKIGWAMVSSVPSGATRR